MDENGEILLEEFITIPGDDVYYVDADGRMVTGQFVRTGEEGVLFRCGRKESMKESVCEG